MKCRQWDLRPPFTAQAIPAAERETFDLILAFGPTDEFARPDFHPQLRKAFPKAILAGCSTCGEIAQSGASEDHLIITGIRCEHGRLRSAVASVGEGDDTSAGRTLAQALIAPDLRLVLVFTEGLHTHAQALVDGLLSVLPPQVLISGGLAGDGYRFQKTVVLTPDSVSGTQAVAVGFYGDRLQVRVASATSWEPFGRARRVTRAQGSKVFELDGKRALEIYAGYLGPEAANLPAAGLVYPVAVETVAGSPGLIRSLSAVNHDDGSLTFFGDIPEGSIVRLMNASYKELIAGASQAITHALHGAESPDQFTLGLLFSCAGRKAVLRAHTDLEIAAVSQHLPDSICLTGFHTYGEIGYAEATQRCEHHNQTMTVTLLSEN